MKYINNLIENLNRDITNGSKEVIEHPVAYTAKAFKDFVVEYWDAAGAIAAGLAFTDYGSKMFEESRWYVFFGGLSIASIGPATEYLLTKTINLSPYYAGSDSLRLGRNISIGMAVWGYRETPEISSKIVGSLLGIVSLVLDHNIREERKCEKPEQQDTGLKKIEKMIFERYGRPLEELKER